MKTTVEIPDQLLREVKELANETGVTMREMIADGLRAELERRRHRSTQPRPDFAFPTFDGGSGLVDGLTLNEAIAESYGDRG